MSAEQIAAVTSEGGHGAGVEPTPPRATQRLTAFPDIAKIAAVIAVVILHVDSAPNDNLAALSGKTWFATVVIETTFRWCVPIFVMVSGMLLLQSRTAAMAPSAFYRRRVARIAVPLVGWSIFYRFFTAWTGVNTSFGENVKAIYSGAAYFHLYFLFVIAGLYLIAPYLARAISGISQRQLGALTLSALTLGFLWGGVPPWLPATGSNAFSLFAPFVGYFLAGCWLARVRVDRELALAGGGIFALVAIAASLATYEIGHLDTALDWHYLYGYLTPPVIVMSLCVFLVIRFFSERREAGGPIRNIHALHYLGEATFGIFLIHPIFYTLWLQSPQGIPTEASVLAWWLPATVVGLIAISLACTLAMKQVPFLRRLV